MGNRAGHRISHHFTFSPALPAEWLGRAPLISGDDTRFDPMEEYVLAWREEACVAAYSIRYDGQPGPFKQAIQLDEVLGVGKGSYFYLYDTIAAVSRLRLPMRGYFGHCYVWNDLFFVTDATGLYCLSRSGIQLWHNDQLAIDGVVVESFDGDIIKGSGEWDPPGGWRPFLLNSQTGELV